MSKICCHCGVSLPDTAKFCDKCGTAVREEAQTPGLFCAGCGAKLEEGEKFCGNCGKPTDSSETTSLQMQPIQNKSKLPLRKLLSGAGAAVLILFLMVFILGTDPVSTVKNGALTGYPDILIGDIFEERFDGCNWRSEERGDSTYVIFNGYDSEYLWNWEIAFQVREDKFRITDITVDGDQYNDALSSSALIEYIYTGDIDSLYGYAFLEMLFS